MTLTMEVNRGKIERPPSRYKNWYSFEDKHTLYREGEGDFYAINKKMNHTNSNVDLRKSVYQFTEELIGKSPGSQICKYCRVNIKKSNTTIYPDHRARSTGANHV